MSEQPIVPDPLFQEQTKRTVEPLIVAAHEPKE